MPEGQYVIVIRGGLRPPDYSVLCICKKVQKKQKVPESQNSQALCILGNSDCSEAITDTYIDIIADASWFCKMLTKFRKQIVSGKIPGL